MKTANINKTAAFFLMIAASGAHAHESSKSFVTELDAHGKVVNTFDLKNTGTTAATQYAVRPRTDVVQSKASEFTTYSGQEAIDRLGSGIAAVAEKQGVTQDYLEEQFLSDSTLRIDGNGNLLFVEDDVNPEKTPVGNADSAPPSAFVFNGDAFKLHSKPNSTKKIYLDFNGQTVTNTAWNKNDADINAEPFNLDGAMGVDTSAERAAIYQIWASVAEDFLPFDVDVTTEEPSEDALSKSDYEDMTYGTRVIITTTHSVNACANCGGIAYIGIFDGIGDYAERLKPAWVFYNALSANTKLIAEAVSHEAGHNMGLFHDGIKNGSTYYTGAGQWAPIMGTSYYRNVTQWSNGAYPNANNNQDDIAVMISKGLDVRTDDYGNAPEQALSLVDHATIKGKVYIKPQHGIIETANDVDMFSFINRYNGGVQFSAKSNSAGDQSLPGNLDIALTLYDANGRVLAVNAPEDKTSAELALTLPEGTYFIGVSSSGKKDDALAHGYDKYGSLGQYTITGYYASDEVVKPAQAVIETSIVTGEVPLVASLSGLESSKNGADIKSFHWNLGNGKRSTSPVPVATYTRPGVYTVSLTVTDEFGLKSQAITKIRALAPTSKTLSVARMGVAFRKARGGINAAASVLLRDNLNKPIRNAVVRGYFSGTLYSPKTGSSVFDETEVVGISNKSGAVTFISPTHLNAGGTVNFTVTDVAADNLIYNPQANRITIASKTKR